MDCPEVVPGAGHLGHLTKPLDRVEADHGTAQGEEGLMDVCPSFIAHLQTPKVVEPGRCTLHHPAMPPQPPARLDPPPRDPCLDPPLAHGLPVRPRIIRLVSMQFAWPMPRPATWPTNRGDRIDHFSNMVVSWTFAAVRRMASGVPRPSTIRWRFEPALPRSVGLRPVFWPPLAPVRLLHPARPAPNRFGR